MVRPTQRPIDFFRVGGPLDTRRGWHKELRDSNLAESFFLFGKPNSSVFVFPIKLLLLSRTSRSRPAERCWKCHETPSGESVENNCCWRESVRSALCESESCNFWQQVSTAARSESGCTVLSILEEAVVSERIYNLHQTPASAIAQRSTPAEIASRYYYYKLRCIHLMSWFLYFISTSVCLISRVYLIVHGSRK